MRGAVVEVKCARCKDKFLARVADRKRGWGKFCSKSCKAIKQTYGRGVFIPERLNLENDDEHRACQEIADRGY